MKTKRPANGGGGNSAVVATLAIVLLALVVVVAAHPSAAFASAPSSSGGRRLAPFSPLSSSRISIAAVTAAAASNDDDVSYADDAGTTDERRKRHRRRGNVASIVAGLAVSASALLGPIAASPGPALADGGSRIVGEIRGSGLVFKDTLNVESFEDPKVRGVTLYITNFQRPLTEKISKGNFFSDPSFASVGCAKTGPVSVADNIALGKEGEEVFEENRSLLFKQLRVQRLYDKEKNTVVYVSFNTRLDKESDANKSRFKSSICAVNLD